MIYFKKIFHSKITTTELYYFTNQFSNLISLTFDLPKEANYLIDFPIWNLNFHQKKTRILGVFKREELISCAGIRIAEIKTHEKNKFLRVGLIGAVATHPHARHLGLATENIHELCEWAYQEGASMVFLWSDQLHFYERLGFFPFGEQLQIPIQELPLSSTTHDIHTGWTPTLFPLLQNRNHGLKLTSNDFTWFSAHHNVEWLSTGTPPTAYAAIGRGIDLPHRVHEWGGDPQHVLQLLHFIQKNKTNSILLGSPYLLKEIFNLSWESTEPMCLAKKLQPGLNKIELIPNQCWMWGLDAV